VTTGRINQVTIFESLQAGAVRNWDPLMKGVGVCYQVGVHEAPGRPPAS